MLIQSRGARRSAFEVGRRRAARSHVSATGRVARIRIFCIAPDERATVAWQWCRALCGGQWITRAGRPMLSATTLGPSFHETGLKACVAHSAAAIFEARISSANRNYHRR
jgi:hypothetical protein